MSSTNGFVMQDRDAALARSFIEEFLRGKGHPLKSIWALPENEAKHLMVEGSVYASLKLTELEDRAQLMRDITGVGQVVT